MEATIDRIVPVLHDIAERMGDIVATTPEGMRAKAAALMSFVSRHWDHTVAFTNHDELLGWSLARDLLGGDEPPDAAEAAPEPDGAIAAIGRQINALMTEYDRLDKACAGLPWGAPGHAAATSRLDDLRDTAWDLRYQAAESPARTLADCAVQAGVILELADIWEGSAIREARLRADLATVRRAAASIVAALAAVARLDIDRLGAIDLRVCCEREMQRAPPEG